MALPVAVDEILLEVELAVRNDSTRFSSLVQGVLHVDDEGVRQSIELAFFLHLDHRAAVMRPVMIAQRLQCLRNRPCIDP